MKNTGMYFVDEKIIKLTDLPLTLRIFSISCSAIIDEPGVLSGPLTREILPPALIIAIWSLPPLRPRVDFLTPEYFLHKVFQLRMFSSYYTNYKSRLRNNAGTN